MNTIISCSNSNSFYFSFTTELKTGFDIYREEDLVYLICQELYYITDISIDMIPSLKEKNVQASS